MTKFAPYRVEFRDWLEIRARSNSNKLQLSRSAAWKMRRSIRLARESRSLSSKNVTVRKLMDKLVKLDKCGGYDFDGDPLLATVVEKLSNELD